MRVIAGSARGRRLEAPPAKTTRPTSDRVRESIFNALGSLEVLEGATVADLFAGSGALGIEALSRGARSATFVDQDRHAIAAVRANLASTGLAERAEVIPRRVEAWLAELASAGGEPSFDVVFCDPPYAFDEWDGLLAALPARLVVIESDRPVAPEGWDVSRSRRYGTTFVMFAEPSVAGSENPPPPLAPEAP